MNILIQIGIGLIPAVIVMWLLLIKRRAWGLKNIFATLLITVCACGTLGLGVIDTLESKEVEASLSKTETMKFTNALLVEGLYDDAQDMLEEYALEYGYDDECRLVSARLQVADGEYERANGIYQYLIEHSDIIEADAEEVVLTQAKATYTGTSLVQLQYMIDSGVDIEEYGYTSDSYEEMEEAVSIDKEDILDEICDVIEDTYELKKTIYEECAESIAALESVGTGDYEDAEKYYEDIQDDFDDIEEESPALANTECFGHAKLRLNIQLGEYEEIVENLNETTDYGTLMVAAELYMSGVVKERDFASEYQGIDSSTAKVIENELEDLYDKLEDDMSVQEAQNLEARIDAVIAELEEPTLSRLKEQLQTQALESAGTEQTKVYLELAKIDNYFNNQTSSDSYMNQAIYSSQDSEDNTYAAAMAELISVINNDDTEDLENIKNVSDYVDAVLDNSLTVDVEAIISAGDAIDSDNQENDEESDEESDEDNDSIGFDQAMEEYVARAKSAISIGQIDTSNFEEITAKVQITSDYITDIDDLKKALLVYDCGLEIEDFTIEKLEYDEMNLLLCCDVSGSMDTAMGDLISSVETFVTDKNEDENISVVTFSSAIVNSIGFGSSDDALLEFAASMSCGGGTSVYDSVYTCLSEFNASNDDNNIIILMTDGQDGSARDIQTIYEELGALALEKGVTIYTLGLGSSVDVEYLTNIADSCNGGFIYVADSYSLTSFYDMLHEQVANQYLITYQAIDTMTSTGRTLKVELPSENVSDNKTYSIGGVSWEETDDNVSSTRDLSVYGLSTKYMYKGTQDIEVKLKGTGFVEEYSTTFKLEGNIDYTISMTYVDEETYSLTIPSYVAAGVYDVDISINGQRIVLPNEFTVIEQGEEEIVEFGAYEFKSIQKIENSDGSITLSGLVIMNDWLNFKGEVTLSGDLEGGTITMMDSSGSYVMYDANTAEGLGTIYAEYGLTQSVPALGNVTLYNDLVHKSTSDDYQVDRIYTDVLKVIDVIQFDSPTLQLYPYKYTWEYDTGTTILPYQNNIMKAVGTASPFDFKLDGALEGIVTGQNVGIDLKIEYGEQKTDYGHQINLAGSPVYFNGSVKIEINTIDNDYLFGAMIRMAFLGSGSGFGAELGWKDGNFDSIKVSVELGTTIQSALTYYIGGVPVTLTSFSLGASDIGQAVESGNYASIIGSGSVGIAAGKVSALLPAAEKFFGDISVFSLPNTEVKFRISPFMIEVSSTLKFLSEIEIAQAEISIGTFDYTNSLLNMFGSEVSGLSGMFQQGVNWKTADGNFHIQLTGSGRSDVHSRFVGITYTGTGIVNLQLWFVDVNLEEQGDISFGFYTTSSGEKQFIVGIQASGSNSGQIIYYIGEDGDMGKVKGTLS